MAENNIDVIIKWNAKEYEIKGLMNDETVIELKQYIEKETGVRPERQKLINVKFKGKPADDSCLLGDLNLKPNFKIMMVGSLEESIQNACSRPIDMDDVRNDLDIEDEEISIDKAHIYLQKIEKRVRDYNIKMISEPRPNKKLLVLDIDYTLFDHRSAAETGYELMRPYLHEFLTSAYQHYDIVIWSATGMMWIEEKMKLLGVNTHQDYKILFYLDYLAMITVQSAKYGVVLVKPLGVIWGKFSQYSSNNTIMFDDVRYNFIMNPQSGLKIRPFRNAHLNRDKDRELLYLASYLKDIAMYCDDFTELNHRKWEKYRPPVGSRDKKAGGSKRKADEGEASGEDKKTL